MWIVFRENPSNFQFVDKNVVALVNDTDILAYQKTLGGFPYEINLDVWFLQVFVRTDTDLFYARKYDVFTTQ
jgi:hypothetical protein